MADCTVLDRASSVVDAPLLSPALKGPILEKVR